MSTKRRTYGDVREVPEKLMLILRAAANKPYIVEKEEETGGGRDPRRDNIPGGLGHGYGDVREVKRRRIG